MVKITETGPDMFWGITMNEGKRYTQTVETSFHVSMAALEPKVGSKDVTSVMVQHDDAEFLLCTLQQGNLYQQPLDLNFVEGESLTLYTTGKGVVHLTGYRVFDEEGLPDGMDDLSEDDLSEELTDSEDGATVPQKKAKLHAVSAAGDHAQDDSEEEDDEDDSEDDDSEMMDEDLNGLLDGEETSSEEEDGEETEAIRQAIIQKMKKDDKKKVNGKQENAKTPQKMNAKELQKKTPESKTKAGTKIQQQKSDDNQQPAAKQELKTPSKQEIKTPNKQEKKTPKDGQTPKQESAQKRKLPSGLVIEDLKVGHGPEAKTNKMAHMYYTGKLVSGKIFDMNTSGKPFKFRLGKNEVIKGWELGVQGMKVGGKRRLTCPPSLGYGNQKIPGIPPNSTLCFDVELKNVS